MEESRTSQFSLCGNFFAHANRNGVLKIWETHSGKLHQDYTPSSHLASLGSCLQWAPFKMRQGSGGGGTKKKKKQRLDPAAAAESAAVETLNLLAWGTEPGDILLYSFAKGELHNRLVGAHVNSRINDLCWSADGTRLFSCALLHLLAEWDVVEGKLMDSWKADKHAAKSISISADGAFLISASRKIKFWDAKTHQLLQIFTGHATPVDTLLFIHPPAVENKGQLASRPYFISAARDDRVINIWQYNPDAGASISTSGKKTTTTTSALVSMTIPEEPQQFSLKQPDSIGEPILLSVVSKAGVLYVFQHRLNGPMQKPLNPKVTINIIDSQDASSSLSVLSSLIRVDKEIMFCFGSFLSPSFEHVAYDPQTPTLTLHRVAAASIVKKALAASSVDSPSEVFPGAVVAKEKVKVLGPGNMASSTLSKRKDATALTSDLATEKEKSPASRKRKLSNSDPASSSSSVAPIESSASAPSFGELLAASDDPSTSRKSHSSTLPSPQLGLLPKPKEKTILLSQGLTSRDASIVNNVLQETNDLVIRNTVKSLAIDYVQPLLDALSPRLTGHSKSATNAAKWLKWVLKTHAGFLLTHGHLLDKMEKMRRAMEARSETLDRATRLQGRLELVLSQVKLRKERREAEKDDNDETVKTTATMAGRSAALYTYEEESDNDDDDDDEELMKSVKDSESEDEDAAMGEWINISAPASPRKPTGEDDYVEDDDSGMKEGSDGLNHDLDEGEG